MNPKQTLHKCTTSKMFKELLPLSLALLFIDNFLILVFWASASQALGLILILRFIGMPVYRGCRETEYISRAQAAIEAAGAATVMI
jgi:hypothetical protein